MTVATEKLAIHGGPKALPTPPNRYKGAARIGREEQEAVLEVLRSRSLFRYYGPNLLLKVASFETEFAQYMGVPCAAACSSGTAALRLGLIALGVGAGDEVIVPATTFIASVNAVVAQGALPVFAEVDEHLTLDPAAIEPLLTERTRAVMPVHLYGIAAEMNPILDVTRKHGVAVLEDTAQACGSVYHDRPLGTLGDAGAFSFQLEKNITSGDGGALITSDADLYRRAVQYSDQGGQFPIQSGGLRDTVGGEPYLGENLRMTEIAGAILSCQLSRLPALLEDIASARQRLLDSLQGIPVQIAPPAPGRDKHGLGVLLYLPDLTQAQFFAQALQAEGVPAAQVYGGKPVYANRQVLERRTMTKGCPFHCSCTDHRKLTYSPGLCPRTENLLSRGVMVATGPEMSDEEIQGIARGVYKVASHLVAQGASTGHD